MSRSIPSILERQVARVHRRLFLQGLLTSLFACWTAALLLSAVWLLVQPLLLTLPPDWLRWSVAGGLVGMATLFAVIWAIRQRPSQVATALLVDERFNLRERVTTSLTLAPHLEASPAAQALLADVNQRVADLKISERFPIRLPWQAALVPLCATLFVLVALFYEPSAAKPVSPASTDQAEKLANADEIEKKIAQVKFERKEREAKPAEAVEQDAELKKFEEDMDRIFNKPRDTKEQAEKRIEEMVDLKKKMEQHEKEMAEKADALKEQLRQADRLAKKQQSKDGPAKDLEKAINQGDMEKAKEEVERLAKKMKNNELSKEEQERLQEQLQDLKSKLERLTRQEEAEEELKELARKGEIDEEQLERELEQLRRNSEKLNDEILKQDLEDIADALQECQRCMGEGDKEGAAKALQRAGSKMGKLGSKEDLERLARQMDQLEEVYKSMCRGTGQQAGNQPNPASGRRPEEQDDTAGEKTRITGEQDPKGRKEMVGTAPGSNFRRPVKPEELVEQIKQASREAPEALERQRIPRAAGDVAKGYFENLGGQKEPEKKGKQ